MIGARFYPVNEEITLAKDAVVQLFDDQDMNLGTINFEDALQKAKEKGLDIVLRSISTNPPICKIMNYRKDLMKKILLKLGK